MSNNFLCPQCRGNLNLDQYIVFSVKREDGKPGLIFLSEALGDYQSVASPNFYLRKGEKVTFFCPMCQHDLVAEGINQNLVKVIMLDNNQEEYSIIFSGIFGEKCTYVIKDDQVEKYGENAAEYINFFGTSPNY